MLPTKQYRAKPAEYGELIKESDDPSQIREYQDSKGSLSSLADNEAWLADNFDKTIQKTVQKIDNVPGEEQPSGAILAAEEERVLRCLGASVITQWNTIPTKLQRQLFDTAGSMGERLNTAELRAQIAKFLHKHKDDHQIV